MAKWTCKKYMGDDLYSWALFKNGVPVMEGMSQSEARYHKKKYESREAAVERLAEEVMEKTNE